MTNLDRCTLCHKFVAHSVEGRAVHMRQVHNVIVQKEITHHTKAELDEIADRMETKYGKEHFFHPSVAVTVPVAAPQQAFAHNCGKCGPTNNDGYWLMDGNGICEPCVKKEAGTDTEIKYQD